MSVQSRLEAAAQEFAAALNAADRAGYEVSASIEWDNGLTAMLKFVRCYRVDLTLNGVHLKVPA